jgi:UDP-N-acetylglucosamine 2-epimerase (non-hydrolysing)
MPMKVMTVVGTRPEIVKLCRIIHALDTHTRHVLVHTGQNYDYELNEIFFQELEIRRPDHFLNVAAETPAQAIGHVIARTDEVLATEAPDALVLLGDTNSGLCVIAAKRRKIPIFHLEAGNRCFDDRVPEEINRRIIDHVSDINLTYTEHARRYLLREGLRPETVIKVGSPMKEILEYYRARIDGSDVLQRLELKPGEFFLVSAHREENLDDPANFANLLSSLNAIADRFGLPVIVSTHPRTRVKLEGGPAVEMDARVRFMKPMGLADYAKLQMNAACVISDSGTVTEEASILNFPAVTIRQSHERPEGMDEGTLIMSGLRPERVIDAITVVRDHHIPGDRAFRLVPDYDTDAVSKKVLRIILSYTAYVNRVVWNLPS